MYKKIFCPVDGSEISERGLKEAIQWAKQQNASLMLLHVVDLGPLVMYGPMVGTDFDTFRDAGRATLNSALAAAHAQGVNAESRLVEIMSGRAGPIIVEEADKYGADLIVMGTHGRRGISRMLLGSDAAAVISQCHAPVLLVK